MGNGRLTLFVRSLSEVRSRRVALGAALGSAILVAADVLAWPVANSAASAVTAAKRKHHHKHKKHKKKKPCTPEPENVSCAGRCGTRTNSCGQPVVCQCPTGQSCLSNLTCARACVPMGPSCPSGCVCSNNPSVDGETRCIDASFVLCDQAPQICVTTEVCPPGQQCQVTQCGPGNTDENRCVPVCAT
jgi:hypothetical protein